MTRRNYRNGQATTLAFPVGALDTTIEVNSATSFPTQYPYTLIIEPDGALEEVVDVTNGAGNVLTVTRGVDSTTASAHSAGVQVYHGISARDHDEANAHVNSTTNVHGITGSIVDTASSQAIPGQKDFANLKSAGAAVVDVSSVQTIGGTKTFTTKPAVTGKTLLTAEDAATITGARTWSGTETHSGAETHSGTVEHTNAAMKMTRSSSSTDDTTSSSTYGAGSPVVGHTFTAPPSGVILVGLSAYFAQTNVGNEAIVSFRIGTSTTIGGGTETLGPSGDRSLVCGMAVVASGPARLQASRLFPVTGLVPGGTYNIQVMFATSPAGVCQIFNREIFVLPLLG